jgi:hypothetical protein
MVRSEYLSHRSEDKSGREWLCQYPGCCSRKLCTHLVIDTTMCYSSQRNRCTCEHKGSNVAQRPFFLMGSDRLEDKILPEDG